MMKPILPFAAVFLMLASAGCTGGGGPQGEVVEVSETPSSSLEERPKPLPDEPGVEVVEGEDGGFVCTRPGTSVKADPNRTYEGGAHQHDDWGGYEEKVIFDQAAPSGWVDTKDAVVITGAGRIDFKLAWTDATTPAPRTLTWTMPGDGKLYKEYSQVFSKSGENHSVAINLSNNDPPHYKHTTWAFELSGPVQNLAITIFRGYDCLPIDPPHYDHWAGATEKLLSVTVKKVAEEYVALCVQPAGVCQGVRQPPVGLRMEGPNTSVPPGTQRLVVEITWKNDHPYPLKFGLEYQTSSTDGTATTNSDKWRRTAAETGTAANMRTLEIRPQPEDWDSPYDTDSLWRFRWFFDSTSTNPALGNSGVFKGEVTFKFTAYKE